MEKIVIGIRSDTYEDCRLLSKRCYEEWKNVFFKNHIVVDYPVKDCVEIYNFEDTGESKSYLNEMSIIENINLK